MAFSKDDPIFGNTAPTKFGREIKTILLFLFIYTRLSETSIFLSFFVTFQSERRIESEQVFFQTGECLSLANSRHTLKLYFAPHHGNIGSVIHLCLVLFPISSQF
jgi:hypothetical protein